MKSKVIGRYQIKEVIGEGSFGKVYKGVDSSTGEEVALKFISRKGKSKKELDNQKEQIQILKKLKHEHIIYLKQFIETPTEIIVVTELAGKDLAALLEKHKRLPIEEIRKYACQIVSALAYLNDNRIVHRDLKPQNILIKDGNAKLCDFGFARKMSAATVCLHSLKGTPLYIAPQIISDKPYNHKIDIWSLGIILYELYTGVPPFYADSYYKLLPKILHDKVKYLKDTDLTLKQLIEGMLQKSPSSRYDYGQIVNHPFLLQKQSVLKENRINLNINHANLGRIQEEEEFDKSFRTERNPSKLRANKSKLSLKELKGIEEDLKSGKSTAKTLKTDVVFYHRLVSLFTLYTLDQEISKDCLSSALRVILGLITKVKLQTPEQRESDITKKQDLLVAVIRLIQNIPEDEQMISTCYNAICYLLKSNFNQVDINNFAAEEVISTSAKVLCKEKLSNGVFLNLLFVIGTLSAQALTVTAPQEFYQMVLDSKILTKIAQKTTAETSTVVFECLKRFVHPAKGDAKSLAHSKVFHSLKLSVANGFLSQSQIPATNYQTNPVQHTRGGQTTPRSQSPLTPRSAYTSSPSMSACTKLFLKIVQSPTQSLESCYSIIYQCVKVSPQFRRAISTTRIPSVIKNQPFSLAISYFIFKEENTCPLQIQKIKASIIHSNQILSPIAAALETNILARYLLKQQLQQSSQYLNVLLRRVGRLLQIPDFHKAKEVESVEGWAFGNPQLKFNDIVIQAFAMVFEASKWDSIWDSTAVSKLWQLIFTGAQQGIGMNGFSKLVGPLLHVLKGVNTDKKLVWILVDFMCTMFNEKQLSKLKQTQSKAEFRSFLRHSLGLIKELTNKDEKKVAEFFHKSESLNFHLFFFQLLDEQQSLLLVLPVLYRVLLQKSQPTLVQDLALNALPKIKKYLHSTTPEALIEIVQIVSIIARCDPVYYPSISAFGIVELLVVWLNHPNDTLKEKTINLIGNLAKHSSYFFGEFAKHKVISSIATCLAKTNTFERMVKNVIYAIGNISFYSDQFKDEIRPLIPHFASALEINSDHLVENTISTLANLVRHSDVYVKDILANGIMKRVLQFVGTHKNGKALLFGLGFILKAVQHREIVDVYRESIYKVTRSINPSDSETSKRILKIQERLH